MAKGVKGFGLKGCSRDSQLLGPKGFRVEGLGFRVWVLGLRGLKAVYAG